MNRVKRFIKNRKYILVFAVAFAVVGAALLIRSFAVTSAGTNRFEAESGALSGNAQASSDVSASGGQYIRFNAHTAQSNSRIRWRGQNWFINGVNVPWYNWSADFGGGSNNGVVANKNAIGAEFAKLKDAGTHVVRWWMFEGDAWQINRDGSQRPTGINNTVYADIDAALGLAETHDLYYNFVLFNSASSFPPSWRTNESHRQALATALGPLFARYKDNPRVMSWEIFNEPEWEIWNNINGVTEADTKAMARAIITSIRTNAPNALITVGQALIDGFNSSQRGIEMWTDVDLDYYSPHWYDPHVSPPEICALCTTAQALQAEYGTNKPIVIGEYYQGGGTTAENVARQNQWYDRGYAGAWGWSLFRDRTADRLRVDIPAMKTFSQQHADIGPR